MREFKPSDGDIIRASKYRGGVKLELGEESNSNYLVLSLEDLEEMIDLLKVEGCEVKEVSK